MCDVKFKWQSCMLLFLNLALIMQVNAQSFQANAGIVDLTVLDELYIEGIVSHDEYTKRKSYMEMKVDEVQVLKRQNIKAGTGSISGYILDNSANPVEGHQVLLFDVNDLVYARAREFADASGQFTFNNLVAGDYLIYTSNNGDAYLNYIWQNTATGGPQHCISRNCPITIDNYISLSAGEVRTNIDFVVLLGGVITGTISDEATSQAVTSLRASARGFDNGKEFFIFGTTDANTGVYSIKGIPNGTFKVFLIADNNNENEFIPQIYGGPECNDCIYSVTESIATQITISSLNTVVDIDFLVQRGAIISGNVLDSVTGDPLIQGLILLFDERNNFITYVRFPSSNSNGSVLGFYSIGGLLPGSYYVQGGDSGSDFYQREVFANKPCYWSGCDRSLGNPVVVGEQESVTNIDFLLEKGGKISGTIISEITELPIMDSDESIQVQFISTTGEVKGGGYISPDGGYTSARALPPGNYAARTGNLFVGNLSRPYVNEKYDNSECSGLACDLTTGDINVTENTLTTGIDFSLHKGNSFSGVISDLTTGDPIPNVHILVYKDMPTGLPKFANWATTSDGTNSPIGSFTVSGLPDGTYYAITNNGSSLPFLGLRESLGGGWQDILYDSIACPVGSCAIQNGTPIIFSSNNRSTQEINMDLSSGASISGTIKDSLINAPIAGVQVNVYDDAANYYGSFTSDDYGHYKTAGLPAGTYYLTTYTFDVMVDMKYGNIPCNLTSCNALEANPIVLTENQIKTQADFILKPDFIFKNDLD